LHVGQLGIGNASCRAAGQIVIAVHLRASGGQQRLFARSAGHRAGTQITDKGPGAKDCRMPRFHRVDIDKTRQTFGNGLHDGTGNGGRCGGTRLTC